tara:strand:- start:482 stop:691 length:210 start_codon:yes stop_codon:yes gene_type:complete
MLKIIYGIAKIEIQDDKVVNISGTDTTILVIDYDKNGDLHKGRKCEKIIMDFTNGYKDHEPVTFTIVED